MLPGKKYGIDDVLKILRRRYWLLLVPCAVVGAGAAARAMTLPNMYAAETVIMVTPQQVPENFVQPVSTTSIQERLPTLETTILSRTRLEGIIEKFDLYPVERRQWAMQDVVGLMKRNISTEIRGNSSFRVSYVGDNPQKVKDVTDSLAALFVDLSLRDRQAQADGTTDFLDSELNEVKAKLQIQERRLSDWRVRNASELPTQLEANVSQIQTTQMALRDLRQSMNSDSALRLEYLKQIGDLENPTLVGQSLSSANPDAAQAAVASATAGTQQQLATAETALEAEAQRGRKPGHPDYDTAARRVRDLQAKLDREVRGVSVPATVSAGELARRRQVGNLKVEVARLDQALAKAAVEEGRLQAAAAEAQRRVDATPQRDTELIELTRDYDTIAGRYKGLLSNIGQSEMAANLERKQAGEQFRLMDPAQLPERPVSPNRRGNVLLGLLIGLGLGAALVVLFEYRDNTFKTDEEIAAHLDLPVLAVVPMMKSEEDLRKFAVRRTFTTAGLGSVVAACFAFAAWVAVI